MNNTLHTSRCARRAFSARAALAAAAFALVCAGCATDQPFAGLGNILGSPAKAQTASAQNSVLAAAQSKVAAGADAKALREELSRVIDGGCYEGLGDFPDRDCVARAYAPAAVEDRLAAASFLLDSGVGVNQEHQGHQEWARKDKPLDEALRLLGADAAGVDKMASLLVSRGANVSGRVACAPETDEEDVCSDTPLGIAAERGSAELVSLLLEKGAKVNTSEYYKGGLGGDGFNLPSPLVRAAQYGRVETVKLLLAKGAKDKKEALREAQSALENAENAEQGNKYKEIISLLKAAGAGGKGKKR